MGRDLTHPEASELLGAYALDALDTGECEAVEAHLASCLACTTEVARHREVAGLLTPGYAVPPPGVWERISAALEEVPPPLTLAPVRAEPPAPPSNVVPLRPRSRRIGTGIAAMVAVAAVAMIGFLGVRVSNDGRRIDELAGAQAPADQLQRSARAAVAAPDARLVELSSTDGARTAEAVLLRDGTGYLVKHNLPTLASDQTYQLWALVGTSKISVGVLGSQPDVVAFKYSGDAWALAITQEKAGGVETTRRDPVVVGRV